MKTQRRIVFCRNTVQSLSGLDNLSLYERINDKYVTVSIHTLGFFQDNQDQSRVCTLRCSGDAPIGDIGRVCLVRLWKDWVLSPTGITHAVAPHSLAAAAISLVSSDLPETTKGHVCGQRGHNRIELRVVVVFC